MLDNNVNTFLDVKKTARLTWIKEENQNNRNLLISLHGYGQLSTYFSRKFEGLQSTGFDLLFPEGLHRFYLKGSAGRVGASWMTKEEREKDILNNQSYLSDILDLVSNSYDKIVLLGFSQGGATAARYYCEHKEKLNGLILWANVFPPDIDPLHSEFDESKDYFVLGDADEYFPIEKQKEVLTLHQNMGLNVVSFAGNHDIDRKTLHSILINI